MQLSNVQNLPDPVFRAILNLRDKYYLSHTEPSDISATALIDSPQPVNLKRKHGSEIVEDAADQIFSLLGGIIHEMMEMATESKYAENRVYAEYGGWKISGQYDYYRDGLLSDYKVCSVWEGMDGLKSSRAQQLNVLKRLLEQNGEQVKKLTVVSIYRDWSKARAEREPDYPQRQVQVHDVVVWDDAFADEYIRERVAYHKLAREKDIAFCTAEDRWAKPDKWAVHKPGAKRAVKLHDDEEDALKHKDLIAGGRVEFRPGESTRCEKYCSVAPFCPQFNGSQA